MRSDWQIKTIGDVCTIVNGGTPKTDVAQYWDGDNPWITPAEMGRRLSPYVNETARMLTNQGLTESSARMLPPSSVILSSRAPIGHLVINTVSMATNQGCKGLIPCESLDHKFLYYYLTSITNVLDDLGTGTTFKELSAGKLKDVLIPLPTLSEQRRIAVALDQALGGINLAINNAKQNILKAQSLFFEYLSKSFDQKGRGWKQFSLGDIASIKGGKRVPKGYKLLSSPTPFPYLRVTDFDGGGSINQRNVKYISSEIHAQIKSYVINSADLYVSIAGTIGRTGIVPEELNGAHLTENACRLVFKAGISNRFVYYFTLTADFISQAISSSRTTAQPKLALSRLSNIRLCLPGLDEQERLVDELDIFRGHCRQLERIYHIKVAKLAEMKYTVLQTALAGKLRAMEEDTAREVAK